MINTKKQLKDTLKFEEDFYTLTFLKKISSLFGLCEKAIIWKYQKRLRKWEFHFNNNHRIRSFLFKVKTNKLGRKYGFSLKPNNFDKGLMILHLGSILVNANTRVGKNCCLHINTSFVSTNGSIDAPVLGDNCKIGIGATLVGGIKLGNNVSIGAGAVVVDSFNEDTITLGGVPAKIISHKGIM